MFRSLPYEGKRGRDSWARVDSFCVMSKAHIYKLARVHRCTTQRRPTALARYRANSGLLHRESLDKLRCIMDVIPLNQFAHDKLNFWWFVSFIRNIYYKQKQSDRALIRKYYIVQSLWFWRYFLWANFANRATSGVNREKRVCPRFKFLLTFFKPTSVDWVVFYRNDIVIGFYQSIYLKRLTKWILIIFLRFMRNDHDFSFLIENLSIHSRNANTNTILWIDDIWHHNYIF